MEEAAVEVRNVDDLYELIHRDPNILDRIDGIPFVDTPLHIAVSAGRTSLAVEIMSLKPSFGRKLNPDGLSPLHLALRNNRIETVERLIKFDSELIRVKGRERLTPLHYVAEANRIDLLAKFLYACPASIEDLTIRNETAVHIAVKNKKLEAFKVLLGWLHRTERKWAVLNTRDEDGNTVLHTAVSTSQLEIVKLLVEGRNVNKNGRNLKGLTALDIAKKLDPSEDNREIEDLTALDIAERLDPSEEIEGLTALDIAERLDPDEARREIVNVLRHAGASKSSSLHKDCSCAEFLMSREKHFEPQFRFISHMGRDMSMEMRNVILVVAVLIATATFQAVISPPGGLPDHNVDLPTNGSLINSTISPNLPINNTITVVVVAAAAATNPYKRVLFQNSRAKLTYEVFFYVLYMLNTIAFIASMSAIIIVLPFRIFSALLHTSLVYLMLSYGISFFVISPTFWYACIPMFASYYVGGLVYGLKVSSFLLEQRCKFEGSVTGLPSHLNRQLQRFQMLHRLVGRT